MKTLLKSSLPLLLLLLFWHALARFHILDTDFFPSPIDIFHNLGKLLITGAILPEILMSLKRLMFGTIISVPLAIMTAILCVHFKFFESIVRPVIAFTYPLPKVAIMPLLMLVFGIGDGFKIAIISLGMFYLIFINLFTAMLKLKDSPLFEVVTIYDIKRKNYIFNFLLKGVWLDFLVAIKIAVGYGLTLVVVSEFSMSKNGIGNFIWKAWDQFKVIDMYAGIFSLCIVGFIIYSALDILISKTTKYYHR